MGRENKGSLGASCPAICWLVAILLGLLVVAILVNWANWSIIIVLVLGLITVVGAGWVLPNYFCRMQEEEGSVAVMDSAADAKPAEDARAVEAKVAADAKAAADAKNAEVKASAKAKNTEAKAATVETDKVGTDTTPSSGEGAKPATLSAARDGKADDLKMIKGIGPKMEAMCNEMGFYHLDQVAAWSADEISWVDANLKGFKGRVTRDKWVAQAKLLAAGGETDFSKRVEDGDVY